MQRLEFRAILGTEMEVGTEMEMEVEVETEVEIILEASFVKSWKVKAE